LLGNFADGWSPTGGTWQVESGVYSGQQDGGNQVSVWHLTMTAGKLGARVQTQSWSGHSHNGFLVFDYVDVGNFKYAGMLDSANKWVIGELVEGANTYLATKMETILTGQWYELEVILSGDTATLQVGGVEKVSHTFASGIDGGPVGLRMSNAHTHFDDVYVKEVVNIRKYYFFGGQRVAMRRDNVLYYIAGDHLGTTSLVLDAQGTKVAESRHFPYGGERSPSRMGPRARCPSINRWAVSQQIAEQRVGVQGGEFVQYCRWQHRPQSGNTPSRASSLR
jgi:hypothetical protein